jgi:hypothetical protein
MLAKRVGFGVFEKEVKSVLSVQWSVHTCERLRGNILKEEEKAKELRGKERGKGERRTQTCLLAGLSSSFCSSS